MEIIHHLYIAYPLHVTSGKGLREVFENFDQKLKMCAIKQAHSRWPTRQVRRGNKMKAKDPTPSRNVNVRDVITQKATESGIVPSDSKKTGFRQKNAK